MIAEQRDGPLQEMSDERLDSAIESIEERSRSLGFAIRMIPSDADENRLEDARTAVERMDEKLHRLRAERDRRTD